MAAWFKTVQTLAELEAGEEGKPGFPYQPPVGDLFTVNGKIV